MNRTSAIRAARTSCTAAQNAGRLDTYYEAEKKGIKLRKEWMATLDSRTRHSHAMLDGEIVDNGEKFSNGLMFPGDSTGRPEEVYNCRCTLVAALDGFDGKYRQTYSEWAAEKEQKSEFTSSRNRNIINTRDMAMGYRRDPATVLTEEIISSLEEDRKALDIPNGVLLYNEGDRTGFSDAQHKIMVRGDVLPDVESSVARDRMSSRAVLAHEYYGHMMNHPSEYEMGDWRDEYRASRDAAFNAPNLSDEDRGYLIIDAHDRAKEAGEFVDYDDEERKILYGKI